MVAVIAIAVLAIVLNGPSAATADPGGGEGKGNGNAAVLPPEPAALAASLKIDGIEGESTAGAHAGEIDVLTWSWGVVVDGASNPTLPVVGRPNFNDITFSAVTSQASPQLMLNAVQGKHVKSAVLSVWKKRADQQQDFFKITLNDVAITSFQQSGSSGTQLAEQFSLSFAQIIMEYRVEGADGSLGETVRTGWDVAGNRPI